MRVKKTTKTMSQAMHDAGLKKRFRNKKAKEIINKLIREECPGGNSLMRWRETMHKIDTGKRKIDNETVMQMLDEIKDDMERAIRAEYNLPEME